MTRTGNKATRRPALQVGDKVRLIPNSPAWQAEALLHGAVGEVVECRDVGASGIKRVTVRFANGRLLMNQDEGNFERPGEVGLKAKGNRCPPVH